ncbi:MAG: three-Cys-motif partner protein TcmP [Candidatus Thorarchaeota archaeon]
MQWAYEHSGNLRNKSDEIYKGPTKPIILSYLDSISDQDYQVGYWTILKNISLAYCLTPFGKILKNNHIKKTLFLDPFCGSGITPLKNPNGTKTSWTLGSPIISTTMTDYRFKSYIYGDISKKSISTLTDIFTANNYFKCNVSIQENDANNMIKSACNNYENHYVFAYLDQSGFQLKWDSLKMLLNLTMFDVILNFQTRLVERIPDQKKKLYFGSSLDALQNCSNCDEVLDQYISQIKKRGVYVTKIRIGKDRSDRYYYHLLHISRKKTYKGIIENLKSRVESFEGKSMKMIWDDLIGDSIQQSLF